MAIPIFHDGIIKAPKHEMGGTAKVADAFKHLKPCCSTAPLPDTPDSNSHETTPIIQNGIIQPVEDEMADRSPVP